MEWLLIATIMLIGALLQGITGFGSGLVAVPLLSLLLPLSAVTPALSIVNILIAAYLAFRLRAQLHIFAHWPLLAAGIVGSVIGALTLQLMRLDWLQLGMALAVIAVGFVFWFGVTVRATNRPQSQAWVGLLSGFSNGALTLGGPPVVLYLSQQEFTKLQFRATLSVFFFALALTNIVVFSISGSYTNEVIQLVVILTIAAVVGATLGHAISAKLSERIFRKITIATVIFAGFVALFSAL